MFFANKSQIRRREDEDQRIQAGCLNLMTNVVIVWNTVQMEKVIEDLRAEGEAVRDDDIGHISPARHEHINPYGRYSFDVGDALTEESLDLPQQDLPGLP